MQNQRVSIFAHTYSYGLEWLANADTLEEVQAQLDAGDFDGPDVAWVIVVPCLGFRDLDGIREHAPNDD